MGGHMGGGHMGGMGGAHGTEGGVGHAAVGTSTTGHATEGVSSTGSPTGHATEGHMGHSTEGGMSNTGNTAHGARSALANQAWGSTTRGTEGGGKVTPPNPHPHPHPREVPPPPPPPHSGCGMLLLPFEIPCRPVPPEPPVPQPHQKDVLPPVSLVPPAPDTPTGVFTGLHTKQLTDLQEKYRQHYSLPRAHAGQETLTAPSIGLNHVPIDKVGTGAEDHHYAKKHGGDMVPPQDPFHLGEWKHEIPGKTVIAGHVSFGDNPGPLYNLSHLGIHHGRPDKVTLQAPDGTKASYTYTGHEIVKDPKDQAAWNRIFAPGDPSNHQLVLVTCTGPKITAGDVKHEPALSGSQGLHKWRLVTYLDSNPPEKPKK